MGIQAIALQGLDQAQSQVEQSARRIAAAATSSGDTENLGAEILSMLSARNAFETNLQLAKTGDELQRSLIDILA